MKISKKTLGMIVGGTLLGGIMVVKFGGSSSDSTPAAAESNGAAPQGQSASSSATPSAQPATSSVTSEASPSAEMPSMPVKQPSSTISAEAQQSFQDRVKKIANLPRGADAKQSRQMYAERLLAKHPVLIKKEGVDNDMVREIVKGSDTMRSLSKEDSRKWEKVLADAISDTRKEMRARGKDHSREGMQQARESSERMRALRMGMRNLRTSHR